MSDKKQQWTEQWARIRERGMWRYIIVHGLLGFGLPFTIGIELLNAFSGDQPFTVVVFALRAIIGGLVFGFIMWRWNERRYG